MLGLLYICFKMISEYMIISGDFQPGQFGSKLAKDVCHDLIYSITQVSCPKRLKLIRVLHSGYRKKRLDPNAESDTSDAESELAYELFADYLSGVASMHFCGFNSSYLILNRPSISTNLGRICKENFQNSWHDLQSSKEESCPNFWKCIS